MKKFSKILSVALLVALVLSLGVANAFAAPADTTLKIEAVAGHKYTAYQLFVGDLAADKVTLSNVKWGADVAESITYYEKANAEATDFTVEKTITPTANEVVPQAVLDYLASLANNTQATANTISNWVGGTGFEITATDTTVKTGYYVVKDAYTNADADGKETTTLSTVMCQVVGPTTLQPKAGTTEHKKEVLDINDSTDVALDLSKLQNVDASKWSDSADYDFEDHVPFKLTTTIADDFAKYTSYYLAVNDTLNDGLKLDQDSIVVYVDGVVATQGTEAGQYSLAKTDKSFKVEFTKLNGNTNAAAGKNVVVYYTATLDSATAVIGGAGNKNESWAEFSNNPNGDQGGKGETPHDIAVVFTYKTDVNKVDGENKPLKGAEFTLTKKLQDGTTKDIAVITLDDDKTQFEFKGLDDGIYTLTETKTPDGYNTIDPITFKVVATHTASGVTVLDVKNEDDSDFTGNIEFTKTPATGTLATTVVNQSGTVLPSTGGIGTTIFYVVGGVLVLAAIILLVTKKRMSD